VPGEPSPREKDEQPPALSIDRESSELGRAPLGKLPGLGGDVNSLRLFHVPHRFFGDSAIHSGNEQVVDQPRWSQASRATHPNVVAGILSVVQEPAALQPLHGVGDGGRIVPAISQPASEILDGARPGGK
jgi:hypothetical protein